MDVNEEMSYECSEYTLISTFITHPLVHIHQKKKIALKIAAKICESKRGLQKSKFTKCVEFLKWQ
jgi:hypothetical protein